MFVFQNGVRKFYEAREKGRREFMCGILTGSRIRLPRRIRQTLRKQRGYRNCLEPTWILISLDERFALAKVDQTHLKGITESSPMNSELLGYIDSFIREL